MYNFTTQRRHLMESLRFVVTIGKRGSFEVDNLFLGAG